MPNHPGIYKASVFNAKDPEGKGRLRLLVPQILGDIPTGWADPAVPPAKKYKPKPGSRVWVTFEGGDPNRPVYMSKMGVSKDNIEPGAVQSEHVAAGAVAPQHLSGDTSAMFAPAGDYASAGHTHPAPDLTGFVTDSEMAVNLATKASLVHDHARIMGPDGRGTVKQPSEYHTSWKTARDIRFHTGAEIGLPKPYYALETISPWSDDSGGGVMQKAWGYGETWVRYGTRAGGWQGWRTEGWNHIETKELVATLAGTIGSLDFNGIPTQYNRLRLVIPWARHTSGTSSSSLYFRFNNDSGNNYGGTMHYHSTGAWSSTYHGPTNFGYLVYSYFYGNSYAGMNMEADIISAGSRKFLKARSWNGIGNSVFPTGYGYGSDVTQGWNNGAQITSMQIWNASSYSWEAGSKFVLMGTVE